MTVDAARAGFRVGEVELDLAHRATGRDWRGFVTHLAPIGVQFLRHHHRYARVRPLAHFRVIHDDGDDVVLADAHERVEPKWRCSRLRCLRCARESRKVHAEH